MGHPRVDPRLVGGGVEDAVQRAVGPAAQRVEEERLEQRGDGAGAGLLRLGRDDVAGEPDGEDALVVVAHLLRPDELPPGCGLPGPVAALVAAGEEDEHAVHEVRGLVEGDAEGRVQHRGQGAADVVEGEAGRPVAGPGERDAQVLAAGAAERHLGRRDQVVPDAARLPREGDAAHGVGQVVIDPGDEAEAVLGGQGSAAAPGAVRHVHAAGLAAQRPALVDGDP
jgi:hypothetical protein